MNGLRKLDRATDDMTEQIKIRVTPATLDSLKDLARMRGTYASSIARRAVERYLASMYDATI